MKTVALSDLIDGGEEATSSDRSDIALADQFMALHGERVRYVAQWGKWFIWDGTRWNVDHTLRIFSMAQTLVRDAARTLRVNREGKKAERIASAQKRAAVVSLVRERVPMLPDDWDRDLMLLNTPEGTVDLRTGMLRTHDLQDYITKITAVAPSDKSPKKFLRFLDRVTGGDKELQAFLQRVSGYALTGSVEEEALFFLWGEGANGKSVLLKTLGDVMHEYHQVAESKTFTASKFEQHATEIASLMGARAVTINETEGNRTWAEARIKQFTGGTKIRAHFMRQDEFEFMPQFKLIFSGQHKPRLRSVDEANRRRMNIIPFRVTIPKGERDAKLKLKLKPEWGGILSWMIEGCLAWQRQGLAPPKSVTEATDDYLEAEDTRRAWLEENCELVENDKVGELVSTLFMDWQQYAKDSGEFSGTKNQLSTWLEGAGFKRSPSHKEGRRFLGLKLIKLKPM